MALAPAVQLRRCLGGACLSLEAETELQPSIHFEGSVNGTRVADGGQHTIATHRRAKVLPWVTCKLAKEQIVPVHTRRGLGGRKEGDTGILKGIAQRPHALFAYAAHADI